MTAPKSLPFFARKAADHGLSIRTGIKAGARESALKLEEQKEK